MKSSTLDWLTTTEKRKPFDGYTFPPIEFVGAWWVGETKYPVAVRVTLESCDQDTHPRRRDRMKTLISSARQPVVYIAGCRSCGCTFSYTESDCSAINILNFEHHISCVECGVIIGITTPQVYGGIGG